MGRITAMLAPLLVILLAGSASASPWQAEGCAEELYKYWDPTFSCPIPMKRCVHCVDNVDGASTAGSMMGCPPELRCPAENPVLQADGTCATELNDDLESPCEAGNVCAIKLIGIDACANVAAGGLFEASHVPCAVCVLNPATECPSPLTCPADAPTLCSDGSCTAGECDAEAENPCECGLYLPCANQNAITCDEVIESIGQDAFDALPVPDGDNACEIWMWDALHYQFFLGWVCAFMATTLAWFCVNERSSNTKESKKLVDEPSINGGSAQWTTHEVDVKLKFDASLVLTGYKNSIIGSTLFFLHIVTVVGFHATLLAFTISYYINDYEYESPPSIETNYVQALLAWIIVWAIGGAWMVFILSCDNFRLHFYARSSLGEADVVRVWQPRTTETMAFTDSTRQLGEVVDSLATVANSVINFVYSDVTRPSARGKSTVCPVTKGKNDNFIIFNLVYYTWSTAAGEFQPVMSPVPATTNECMAKMGGLTTEQAATALGRFGPNLIEVPMPSLWNSIFNEFTKGFYTYQMFMAWTWLNFTYWHMGVINMLVFSLGGLIVAYNEHKNRVVLHKLVKDDSIATVIRNGQPIEVPAANLVPGDVIEVKEGSITVDCVMLQGSTVVDESSLTGESTPVFKTHVDTADRPPSSKACQLFAGTSVVDGGSTAEKALALVVKTGGNTDKGRQVAEILFRDAPIFKFDVQVIPVLGCLCVWAVFGFCLTLNFLGDEPVYSFFFGMYVVASALPPLLPTVFVVSVGIASERLRKRGVVCSDPQRLLVAGKVRVCCFDKTGTLTKNGMDFHGVRECKGDVISGQHSETIPAQSTLEYIMASCHTLSSITSSGGSMLVGTAVDKMMFGATGWSLVPSKTGSVVSNGTATLHEARRFNFDFVRQTSSVIVRNEQGKHMIFVKGSAEAIAKTLGSTPEDFAAVANSYARDGCYTLALAWRVATPNEEKALAAGQNVERGDAEFNLAFAGFLTFRNDLKEDSKQALEKLREGACRCIMLTGDHALTGVHIAREVGMLPTGSHVVRSVSIKDDKVQWVDEDDNSLKLPEGDEVEIVMLGAIWRELSEAEKTRLLPRVRIFARAAPDDKLAVVALIIKQGLVVSMCGDGGNDCGALRAAHVGVALSEAEASVVSPFTGIEKSCMSVVDVLLEGRASLASAIACYKYMLMYGVVETCNQMIQAYFAVTFSEWCWVFMDGFWVVSFSLSLALARPAAKLSPERPPSSLLGGYVLSSFLGTFFIHFIITIVALAVLNAQDFYQCRRWDTASADLSSVVVIGDNYESEVIFLVTGAQYITSAMTFNFGHKHRANWLNNYVFVFFAVLWLSIHFHITLVPSRLSCLFRVNCDSENIDGLSGLVTGPLAAPDATECGLSIQNFWGTTRMPEYFRPIIIGLILADMALCMAWEKLVLHGPPGRAVRAVYRAGHKNKLTELKI